MSVGEWPGKVIKGENSHVMVVSANCERETAFDFRIGSLEVGILQRTGRQHSFLRVVEGDCKKFVPVTDKVFLHDNLMKSQFPLS